MARFWILLLFVTGSAFAAPPVPVGLSSLAGEVFIWRAGVLIPSEKIREGFLVEPFDTVSTGVSGRADIRLSGVSGLTAVVHLDPKTSVYLDFSSTPEPRPFVVTFFSGGVSASVSAASGAALVEVRTDSGVFSGGVPGFRVFGTDEGDLLVTSRSGTAACRIDRKTIWADPGTAVEVLARNQGVHALPVNTSTLAVFEATWAVQRKQVFRDQGAAAFRAVAARYQRQLSTFQRAWDRYQRESADGPDSSAAAAELRRVALPLERSLPALRSLRTQYDEGLMSPTLELSRGYLFRDFLRQVALDEGLWVPRLQQARGLYRAVAERNGGIFPAMAEGLAVTWDSDFFQ